MQANTSAPTNLTPPPRADKIVKTLDKISDVWGKLASYLVAPMLVALVYEVVSRYFFNAPTIWAGDVALICYGIYFMIGSPYCLKEGMHIRTDFLYSRWSIKTKGLVDFITYLLLYLPTHAVFLEIGWKYFYKSFKHNEVIISSPWMPIIWPMKLAIPVSLALMILQGVSETIKAYYAWRDEASYWGSYDEHDEVSECQAVNLDEV